ncbi:MAG: EI24 domain-containing protein [Deltaproteobacteria bacterium]|nr:MAG: EI24 domain-containing protein [Deltaproteobacteria bacterium]
MNLFSGITYNLRGLLLGLRSPKLLVLGLIRFAAVVIITMLAASLVLVYHEEILNFIWAKPTSQWILWLWHVVSWLLTAILVGFSTILSYLISQILFSVLIMDFMSRITERMITGEEKKPEEVPIWRQFAYLVKQEIPRSILPVLVTLILMIVGWLTPLGPVLAIVSSGVAAIFLAWDNTDLTPARRQYPFKTRFKLFLQSLPFHLGFGLLFLVPLLNILFLSFAPVGATMYYTDKHDEKQKGNLVD